jgi:AbrB family looped-hinge helix DNA binding protein
MSQVTVSSKFQIVIPREVRETLHIKPGQKLGVLVTESSITLMPLRPIEELRGILKGNLPPFEREPDREF